LQNKPKAIFVDIDGTLLNHDTGMIPESAAKALHRAAKAGIKLFVATGRNHLELAQVEGLAALPFDGFVTLNGCYCYVGDKVVHKEALAAEQVAAVVARLETAPFPVLFCEEHDMYINIQNHLVKKLQGPLNLEMPRQEAAQKALGTEIFQMVAFADEAEHAFLQTIPGVRLIRWTTDGYDIMPEKSSKWEGILHMLSHFDISPKDAAAIGDGENDIEMLENAGASVAMGNAAANVQKSAKHVTAHINDDGFALAIDYLLGL